MATNSCWNQSRRFQDYANPAGILWELVPVIFSHCLRHKEKMQVSCDHKWKKHVKDNSTCRDHQDRQWRGRRTREPLKNLLYWTCCFPFALWKIYLRMNAIINLGETARSHWSRSTDLGIYFRRIAQNVISRLWWRSTRALERSALSLTNCLRFVTGPSKPFRASILDLPCLTRWKAKADEQRLEGGSLVNKKKCVFVNIYARNRSGRTDRAENERGKNLSDYIKRISFKLTFAKNYLYTFNSVTITNIVVQFTF